MDSATKSKIDELTTKLFCGYEKRINDLLNKWGSNAVKEGGVSNEKQQGARGLAQSKTLRAIRQRGK